MQDLITLFPLFLGYEAFFKLFLFLDFRVLSTRFLLFS